MLTEFHVSALMFMLDHPDDQFLKAQIPYLSLAETEHTGVGCFYSYTISADAPISFNEKLNSEIYDGHTLFANGISKGAGMILFIREGKISFLEMLANTGEFPKTELTEFRFEKVPVNWIDLTKD